MMNFELIRQQFPQVEKLYEDNKKIVYLDSAASTLKPKKVIDVIYDMYLGYSANVHRGAHNVSDLATEKYENARKTVAKFLNATSENEIIFTKGTTESINLVAQCLGEQILKTGDKILLTEMEHHSNLVPWHLAAKKAHAEIEYIEVSDDGELDLSNLENLISEKVKIASLSLCSNTLGTVNDLKSIIKKLKSFGIIVVVDAAQAMTTTVIDVQDLGCDFLAFSGHKIFAPTGIGVLWGKEYLLNDMGPYQGGGSMIVDVSVQSSSYLPSPQRYEAGTPNIVGAIGLAEAVNFISEIGVITIANHEKDLLNYLDEKLETEFPMVKRYGVSPSNINVRSFNVENVHPADVGMLLNQYGIAVRTGHHCTQPLMNKFSIKGTVRASISVYNNKLDIDKFLSALKNSIKLLI